MDKLSTDNKDTLSPEERVKAGFDTAKSNVKELSDNLISINEVGAPALTAEGMAANMVCIIYIIGKLSIYKGKDVKRKSSTKMQ